MGGTFELDVHTDGSFVVIDQEIVGPFVFGGEFVGRAEFFVAEPTAEAEAFEDFLESGGFEESRFEFFADFVAFIRRWGGRADGKLFGRRFESEEIALGGRFRGRLFPFCIGCFRGFSGGGGFRADAEELAVFGEAAVRGVKDKVHFMNAGRDRLSAEFGQGAQEGFGVGDAELDFDLGRHRRDCTGERLSVDENWLGKDACFGGEQHLQGKNKKVVDKGDWRGGAGVQRWREVG